LRVYIKTCWLLGYAKNDISNDFKTVRLGQAPSYEFVKKWVALLNSDRERVEYDPRSGRPITALTDENILAVGEIVEDNPYVTYAKIEALNLLYPPKIHSILHDHLRLRKIESRSVPNDLTNKKNMNEFGICQGNLAKINNRSLRLCNIITGDELWFCHRNIGHKQSNVSWVGVGGTPKNVVCIGHFEPKTMISIFSRTTGFAYLSYLDKGEIIESKSYIEGSLKPMLREYKRQRPNSGLAHLKLHHNNDRRQVAECVITFLEGN